MARDSRLLASVVVALGLAAGLAGWASGQTPPGNPLIVEHWNGAAWKVTPAVAPRGVSELHAVTAVSPTDLWAVGSYVKATRKFASFPLAEHYNGTWSPVVLPTPNKRVEPDLNAVSANSAKDVWAVGSIGSMSRRGRRNSSGHTLIERFDGKGWKVMPSVRARGSKLRGVAALTRRNAWAVGFLAVKRIYSRPLIEHWNGSVWRRVASPNPRGSEDALVAIAARSARDIWAVGNYRFRGETQPLVLHWNGLRWKQVASPSPSRGGSLSGLAVLGAKDAWAVGEGGTGPLTEHWNGRAWRVVSVRLPAGSSAINCSLSTVSASSSTDVWAAGQDVYKHRALVEHWDGHAWTTSRAATAGYDSLSGIAVLSARDVWAVGVRTARLRPLEGLR
jgi:hypothetical protein